MALPDPVIFVPRITGPCLSDEYPLSPETVWSPIRKDYKRISLHPDNSRYEVHEPALLTAGPIYEVSYKEIIEDRYRGRPRQCLPASEGGGPVGQGDDRARQWPWQDHQARRPAPDRRLCDHNAQMQGGTVRNRGERREWPRE